MKDHVISIHSENKCLPNMFFQMKLIVNKRVFDSSFQGTRTKSNVLYESQYFINSSGISVRE